MLSGQVSDLFLSGKYLDSQRGVGCDTACPARPLEALLARHPTRYPSENLLAVLLTLRMPPLFNN